MGHTRRALLLIAPAAVACAQTAIPHPPPIDSDPLSSGAEEPRLPNGRNQQDEILKADYDRNLKDARDLIDMAKTFEEDLERDDRFVLSLNTLKKLDNMEAAIKRIRGRLKRN